ncbi:MAG: diadenylate cyclase CdaA [Candidatus Omnitrophica bacterium]|nr:diadenylate cyclase CdaA [Candidatus Omnitrophota bacterium]MBU1852874.1 diadenylate cyclase CdaA [Candidatus Omnitrophota bacterium]
MLDYISLFKILVEIGILWFVFYVILIFSRGTRGVHVLKGIILIVLVFIITQQLGLDTINWIFTKLFAISVIAVLIIFQPELRRGLASIGQHRWAGFFFKEAEIIRELVNATIFLSKRKIGALVAIERESRLSHYVESGIEIDAHVNTELVITIFTPTTPLHDGGIIISGNRIVAAGCLFPLTQNPEASKTMGTRHRAGLGLSEETDAAVIIVSEETGGISVAINGRLTHDLDKDALERVLYNLCKPDKKKKRVVSFKS